MIATHMRTRGCDEHHKLKFGDFTMKCTTDGHEYIEFSAEWGIKMRTGEIERSTNANARLFKPIIWTIPDRPAWCPVWLYKAFVQRRPPEMCTADSPLYLAVNHNHNPTSFWYKKQPLGVTLLNRIMKELADKSGIEGRKTMIQTLCSAIIPDSTIMQLSGHKSLTSLNHYKKPSLDQQNVKSPQQLPEWLQYDLSTKTRD